MKFAVSWCKNYQATGEIVVEADSEEEARKTVEEQLDMFEGTMQHVDSSVEHVEKL